MSKQRVAIDSEVWNIIKEHGVGLDSLEVYWASREGQPLIELKWLKHITPEKKSEVVNALRFSGYTVHSSNPDPKELTEQEKSRLKDEFEATLTRELGTVPENSLAEFRVELDMIKEMPFAEAQQRIVKLAMDIAERWYAKKVVKALPPRERVVKVGLPEEEEFVPWVARVVLPKEPICKELLFPRAPCSQEKVILWDAFRTDVVSMGLDYTRFMKEFQERINLPYRSWDAILKTYDEFIKSIVKGAAPMVPLWRVPMPWREDTEENYRFDAIVHLTSIRLYKTIDDLIHSLTPPGLEAYGVTGVTPDEVKKAIKKAWKEKNLWFKTASKEWLEEFIEEKIED